jgi:hypothetical protein
MLLGMTSGINKFTYINNFKNSREILPTSNTDKPPTWLAEDAAVLANAKL